jgi:hypothetical protein
MCLAGDRFVYGAASNLPDPEDQTAMNMVVDILPPIPLLIDSALFF